MTNKSSVLFALAMTLAACGTNEAVPATSGVSPNAEALSPFIASKNKFFVARLEWVSGAPRPHQLNTGRVAFYDANQQVAQRVDVLTAQAWMPAHNHPPFEVKFDHVASGPANVWDFAGLQPSMSGDWALRLQATVDGNADTVDLTFNAQ